MPRTIFLLGVGIVLVAAAFVVTHEVVGPKPGPTAANARRIKVGMQLHEVEAILGGPGRATGSYTSPAGCGMLYNWDGPDGVVCVCLSRSAE
jgi:hypothetical protein